MTDWTSVRDDPFAAAPQRPAPGTSLTIHPKAPPPETRPDAPLQQTQPNALPGWTPVKDIPDFSGPPAAPEEPEPSPGFLKSAKIGAETFATDLHNQRAAASQGTTPNIHAHMPNLLSSDVHTGDDDNLYFKDAEGRLQPTDENKHVVLRDPADKRLKVFSRTEGTDEGMLSSAGRLMMTGMMTETPRFGLEAPKAGVRVLGIGQRNLHPAVHPDWMPKSTDTQAVIDAGNSMAIHPGLFHKSTTSEAIKAAERLGVNLPKAIASESGNVHYMGQVFKGMPGGTPLREGIEEGIKGEKGLSGALKRVSSDIGGVADTKAAGEGVTTGLEGTFKPESQKLVKQLYDRVDKLVDPTKTAPLSEVMKTVGDILARRQSRGNNELGAAVEEVSGALQRPGGLTYEGMKDLRTALREIKQKGEKGGLLPPGMSQGELNDIYKALTKDLGNAAEITGGPAAKAAWERANTLSHERKDVLEVLNKVVGPKTRSDEGVMEALHRMAGTGAGADIETLSTVRKSLKEIPGILPGSPGSWENVASTIVSRLGKNSHGEFSPNLFVRDYNDLSSSAKRILFHTVGKGDVVGALDDIATVSQKYIQAGKLANTSGTAGHYTAAAAFGSAITAAFHGDYTAPIAMLGGLLGANLASRTLGNPGTVKSVARWTRAVDAVAKAPTARTISAYNIASRNLGNTTAAAAGDPSLAPHLIGQLQGAVRRPGENQDQQR